MSEIEIIEDDWTVVRMSAHFSLICTHTVESTKADSPSAKSLKKSVDSAARAGEG